MLTNGTETKGQEYKQINAAKKQKNQQGFGNLTELGGGFEFRTGKAVNIRKAKIPEKGNADK